MPPPGGRAVGAALQKQETRYDSHISTAISSAG